MYNKIILAIETSGKICSVALGRFHPLENALNYELIAEYSIYVGNKHDKFCADLCNRIIKDNNYDISKIDAVAISIGPGSWTGLRIGVSIAKGITFDSENKISLIAVPTLCALSYNAISFAKNLGANILSIISSHSNLVYYQLFDNTGIKLNEAELISLDSLYEKYLNENVIITTNYPIDIKIGKYVSNLSYITANTIAEFGAKLYMNKEISNSIDIQPLYLQDFMVK
ncbi:MAG: tRNA (adenosine(37)-N6)-threonylcarbamoyltransferase complex dimerization subunit type 1 TsaB [Bacteroidetes bacterium]|nr:tRNA (adenosine(37)-N6)-threonylcarbamoyltransferase complex dimerization subunit type 1 TsaB [Bacteroidota bacterium]